jgi:hypothetical protein
MFLHQIYLLYPSPLSPLLKTISKNFICVLIGALFTIAKKWNQSMCPSTNKWTKNIYTMEYYSGIKKNENVRKMNGSRDHHVK